MRAAGRQDFAGLGFLWGAAHALNLGGLLIEDVPLRGPVADAEALAGDWRRAIASGTARANVQKVGTQG